MKSPHDLEESILLHSGWPWLWSTYHFSYTTALTMTWITPKLASTYKVTFCKIDILWQILGWTMAHVMVSRHEEPQQIICSWNIWCRAGRPGVSDSQFQSIDIPKAERNSGSLRLNNSWNLSVHWNTSSLPSFPSFLPSPPTIITVSLLTLSFHSFLPPYVSINQCMFILFFLKKFSSISMLQSIFLVRCE